MAANPASWAVCAIEPLAQLFLHRRPIPLFDIVEIDDHSKMHVTAQVAPATGSLNTTA